MGRFKWEESCEYRLKEEEDRSEKTVEKCKMGKHTGRGNLGEGVRRGKEERQEGPGNRHACRGRKWNGNWIFSGKKGNLDPLASLWARESGRKPQWERFTKGALTGA